MKRARCEEPGAKSDLCCVLRFTPLSSHLALHTSLDSAEGFWSASLAASLSSGGTACDSAVVIRLRTQYSKRAHAGTLGLGANTDLVPRSPLSDGTSIGSPVLLIKNYLKDRGQSLMREFGVNVRANQFGKMA